ncbi:MULTISPECIES: hypothetical protein [Aerosakkonema]
MRQQKNTSNNQRVAKSMVIEFFLTNNYRLSKGTLLAKAAANS